MVLHEVVQYLLRDTRKSVRNYRNNPTYQRLLARERRMLDWYAPCGELGLALRRGHLQVGSMLHQLGVDGMRRQLAVGSEMMPNAEVRALVHYVGRVLIRYAQADLSVEALRMSSKWDTEDSEGQYRILQELGKLHNVDSAPSHHLQDILDQPLNRSLPWKSRVSEGGKVLPNCQGKAQRAAAFAALVGCEQFVFTPIVTSNHWYQQIHIRAMEAVLPFFELEGLTLSEERGDRVREVLEFRRNQQSVPSYQHCGVIWQLRNGCWAVHDPGHKVFVSLDQVVEEDLRKVGKYRSVLPGMSLQIGFEPPGRNFEESVEQVTANVELACELVRKAADAAEVRDIVAVLARSEVLDKVASWEMYRYDFTPKHTREHRAAILLYDFAHLWEQPLAQEKKSLRDVLDMLFDLECAKCGLHMLLYHFVMCPITWIEERWNGINCKDVVYHAAPSVGSKCWLTELEHPSREFVPECHDDFPRHGMMHPAIEVFAHDHYALALPVIAHAALELKCATEVAKVLAEESYCQFRLFYDLLGREGEAKRGLASFIERMPFKLRSVEHVLPGVLQERVPTPLSERNPDVAGHPVT